MSANDDEPVVAHEATDWFVINKPSRYHTVKPGRRARDDSLRNVEAWLEANVPELQDIPECGLVYRLDYLTSGCLIAARSIAIRDELTSKWRDGTSITKDYLAVVDPGPQRSAGEFSLYFSSRYRRSKKVTVDRHGPADQLGRCRWRRMRAAVAGGGSLLCVRLIGPGHRHQIRAGLAFLGMPIAGDDLYGGRAPWAGGFGLHAWRMTINEQTISVEPPDAWKLDCSRLSDES